MAGDGESTIVAQIVDGILARYRIDAGRATDIVRVELAKSKPVCKLLASGSDAGAISRTSAYKTLEASARKAVYTALRKYRSPEDLLSLTTELRNASPQDRSALVRRIAEAHVSTRERLDSLTEFHERVAPFVKGSVIDIGCGVYPMLFAEGFPDRASRYLALDRDPASLAALDAYAESAAPWLETHRWNCSDGWEEVGETYDVALLLKVVPVIHRQERDSLAILQKAPARMLIVTGARESMTKRQSIERRERGVLQDFLSGIPGEIVGEFETADEIGFVFRRS